jgi:hypothetical protein
MAVSIELARRLCASVRLAATSGATPATKGNGPGASALSSCTQHQGARLRYWLLGRLFQIWLMVIRTED